MNRKVLIDKARLMKSSIRKTLHKHGKSWIIFSLSLLAMIGGMTMVGHADVNSQYIRPEDQVSEKPALQKITDRAITLHSSILRNSSNQNKQVSSQSNNVSQNDLKNKQSCNNYSAIKTHARPLTNELSGPNPISHNTYMRIDIRDAFNYQILAMLGYHSDGHNHWLPNAGFRGVPVNQPISLYSLIPKGYRYIDGPNTYNNPSNALVNKDGSFMTFYGTYGMKNPDGSLTFDSAIWWPSSNQIKVTGSDSFSNNEISLYVYPILLTQGNVKVKVIRHFLNGSSDIHWVDLPSSKSAVTDVTNSHANGDGYSGDSWTYTLPSNWQSFNWQSLDHQSKISLKGFIPSSDRTLRILNGTTQQSGTFQLGNSADQGANLINGVLTLNYNQLGTIYINYVNSKTGQVIKTQNAGGEPNGIPFDYREFENADNLPAGYRLDNNARDGWNLNPVHYPSYKDNNQTDVIYVDKIPTPKSNMATDKITYQLADNTFEVSKTLTGKAGESAKAAIDNDVPNGYSIVNGDNVSYDNKSHTVIVLRPPTSTVARDHIIYQLANGVFISSTDIQGEYGISAKDVIDNDKPIGYSIVSGDNVIYDNIPHTVIVSKPPISTVTHDKIIYKLSDGTNISLVDVQGQYGTSAKGVIDNDKPMGYSIVRGNDVLFDNMPHVVIVLKSTNGTPNNPNNLQKHTNPFPSKIIVPNNRSNPQNHIRSTIRQLNNAKIHHKSALKHDIFELRQDTPVHSHLIKRFIMSGYPGTGVNVAKMIPRGYQIIGNSKFIFDGKTHVVYLKLAAFIGSNSNNHSTGLRKRFIKKTTVNAGQIIHQTSSPRVNPRKLSQTNEVKNYTSVMSMILIGLAVIITSLSKVINKRKHD